MDKSPGTPFSKGARQIPETSRDAGFNAFHSPHDNEAPNAIFVQPGAVELQPSTLSRRISTGSTLCNQNLLSDTSDTQLGTETIVTREGTLAVYEEPPNVTEQAFLRGVAENTLDDDGTFSYFVQDTAEDSLSFEVAAGFANQTIDELLFDNSIDTSQFVDESAMLQYPHLESWYPQQESWSPQQESRQNGVAETVSHTHVEGTLSTMSQNENLNSLEDQHPEANNTLSHEDFDHPHLYCPFFLFQPESRQHTCDGEFEHVSHIVTHLIRYHGFVRRAYQPESMPMKSKPRSYIIDPQGQGKAVCLWCYASFLKEVDVHNHIGRWPQCEQQTNRYSKAEKICILYTTFCSSEVPPRRSLPHRKHARRRQVKNQSATAMTTAPDTRDVMSQSSQNFTLSSMGQTGHTYFAEHCVNGLPVIPTPTQPRPLPAPAPITPQESLASTSRHTSYGGSGYINPSYTSYPGHPSYTGRYSSQNAGTAFGTWISSPNPTERFYVDGTNTHRRYIQQADYVANWEENFYRAGRSDSH